MNVSLHNEIFIFLTETSKNLRKYVDFIRKCKYFLMFSGDFSWFQSSGGRRMPSKKGGGPQYGLKPQQQAQQPPPEPPPPPPAPISLSSTGMLSMSSAWMPPPPPSAGGSAGSRTCVGSATYHEKTVPRLMPDVGDGVVTSVDEVDQLTQLLRKRAEMKQSRPSTAGTRNHMNGRYGS